MSAISATNASGSWCWQDNDGNLVPYDSSTQALIQSGLATKETSVFIEIANNFYEINFQNKTQTNLLNNFSRKIAYVPAANVGISALIAPAVLMPTIVPLPASAPASAPKPSPKSPVPKSSPNTPRPLPTPPSAPKATATTSKSATTSSTSVTTATPKTSSSAAPKKEWYYECGGAWTTYDLDVQDQIQLAAQSGIKKFNVIINKNSYEIDLVKKQQKNLYTGNTRQIDLRDAPKTIIRRYGRLHSANYIKPEGQKLVKEVLDDIKKDPILKKAFDSITAKHRLNGSTKSEQQAWGEKLNEGTCYGQSMRIIEALHNADKSSLSISSLYANIDNEKEIMRYQILHDLRMEIQADRGPHSHTFQHIGSLLPSGNRAATSPTYAMQPETTDTIKDKLNQFLSNQKGHPLVLRVSLFGSGGGHVFSCYIDDKTQQYYLYDSYSDTDGLFGAPTAQALFDGIADRIHRYARGNQIEKKMEFITFKV